MIRSTKNMKLKLIFEEVERSRRNYQKAIPSCQAGPKKWKCECNPQQGWSDKVCNHSDAFKNSLDGSYKTLVQFRIQGAHAGLRIAGKEASF